MFSLLTAASASIVLTQGMTSGPAGRGGRIPFPTDRIVAQLLANKDPMAETEGWTEVKAGADGWFDGLRGYTRFTVAEPEERVAVLKAAGHGMVYVNYEPRMGDPYGFGYLQVPIQLHQGTNTFLFANGRGRLHAEIEPAKGLAQFGGGDYTLPDFVAGASDRPLAAVPVLNTSRYELRDLVIAAKIGNDTARTRLSSFAPFAVRKIGFALPAPKSPSGDTVPCELSLLRGTAVLDSFTLHLRIRKPDQSRKVTFRSTIDGSVQYFGVVPPTEPKPGLGIVLSCHGASVEGIGQAEAYSAKSDFWIVAPTNRRPYGFDWEDWGRMDAMEVLAQATALFKADPAKTMLTGHSMGGHGTWILGATFPDRFAAIAPSAGWRSFYTYGGKPREAEGWQEPFARASNSSDIDLLMNNFLGQKVYILHGDADDNVPVTEARAMKEALTKMQVPIGYHEQPGAGHWWDGDRAAGADCVDWPDIFDLFRRSQVDGWRNNTLSFTTVNPVVNTGSADFEILQQEKRMAPSTITVSRSSEGYRIVTANTGRIRFKGRVLEVDGQPWTGKPATMEKRSGKWVETSAGVAEAGPFKEAMRGRVVLVYGTKGTPEENAWALAKARFDGEQFLYRGSGDMAVMSDDMYLRQGGGTPVLYGNQETNGAWARVIGSAPVVVTRSSVKIEKGPEQKGDLAVLLFVKSRSALVIGGTSLTGMMATSRLPYFVSGVAYPDWTVLKPTYATGGYDGVVSTGFWGAGTRPTERWDR